MKRMTTLGFVAAGTLAAVSMTLVSMAEEGAEVRESVLQENDQAIESEVAERLDREGDKDQESRERDSEREHDGERERDSARGVAQADRAIREHELRLRELQAEQERLAETDVSKAARSQIAERMGAVKRELTELRAARERQLSNDPERHEGRERPQQSEAARAGAERIRRILMAAQRLEAAGVHDLARALRADAEQMERELHQPRRHSDEAANDDREREESHGLAGQLEDLRREVRQLREELNGLREHVGRR